tara:strand:+ start:1461 stop:3029 length:1569 start_codon:yes stop_codon:yes gene_type:complete
MALVIKDRVKETTDTTGASDDYDLLGAVSGFKAFSADMSGNDTTYYVCTDNNSFEIGIGTYNSSTDKLARTTLLASSTGSAINWSSGTRTIFMTYPADKAVFQDASGNINMGGQDIINVGVSSADTHAGIYGSSSSPVEFTVTVASKTAAHPYPSGGSSSSNAYFINGIESPVITLHGTDGVTSGAEYYYRFTLSSSDMSNHPFRLYLDAAKTAQYTTNVTTTSTYLQIAVDEDTPSILYYQCSSHGFMGNHAIVLGSNVVNHNKALASFPTTTGTLVGTGDTGSVSNTMLAGSIANDKLAGSIANAKLANSSITVADNSSSTAIALGGTVTFLGTSNEVQVAENSGTVTIGLPDAITANVTGALTGNADTATALATGRTIAMTGDVAWTSASFDGSGNVTGSATIQADAVEQSMIADDAVGADQLASDAVVTASIVNGNVTQAKIADDAVGADQLASNAVVNASVASGAAIDATKIHDGSISNTEFGHLNNVSSNIQTQLDAKTTLTAASDEATALAIALG